MANIFNSDLTKEGYDAGFSDGKNAKTSDHSGALKRWKSWIYGDNAVSTWAKGYDKGYTDGCAKRNEVYK